jgi:thiol:disulfide interchange protein DsbC
MKSFLRHCALMLTAMSLMMPVTASVQADAVTDKLKTVLQSRLGPDEPIISVSKSPVPGLYEINVGRQIIYSDANGDYLLLGDLIETRARTNLTQQRVADLNRIKFETLPLANAIKVVKGNGSRKIAVFSDPNCKYCRGFENTLRSIDNVTVYTFLYPILSPDSTTKAKSIWCASDRAQSWESWMVDRKAPTGAGLCDTTVLDKNLELGNTLNVSGTPTVFLTDGSRLPGAVSADELEKRLSVIH